MPLDKAKPKGKAKLKKEAFEKSEPATGDVKKAGLMKRDKNLAPEQHGDSSGKLGSAEQKKMTSAVTKQVDAAKKAGKKFYYGREGGVAGRQSEKDAQSYAAKQGVDFRAGSLEDKETDIKGHIKKTKMGKYLRKKFGKGGAEASQYAFLKSQGDKEAETYRTSRGDAWMKQQGIADPGEKGTVGSEKPSQVSKQTWGAEDYGQTKNISQLNRAQQAINRIRRGGVAGLVKRKEREGYHVGGTFGAGHFSEMVKRQLHNSMEKRKPQSHVNAIPRGKVSSMGKQSLDEDRVIQGAPKGAFGLDFNNAWKLKSKDKSWLSGGKEQLQDMNMYDLAKMCTEPEGGYLDPDEMDKASYSKAQRDSMRTEEVYGQGSLATTDVDAPSVDEEKLAKRKKRVHGKLHPHKKGKGT